jgi:alkaline phosphatase D
MTHFANSGPTSVTRRRVSLALLTGACRAASSARGAWRLAAAATLACPTLATAAAGAGTQRNVPRFTLGVASGYPRPDGMVLWTRLTGPGLPHQVPVRWEVAEDDTFRRVVAHGTETAEATWAHSVHAEPVGLAPGRWYAYRFTALGDRSETGRTRTAPAPHEAAPLKFAIASCQRFEHGHYAAWRDVAESAPDLILFLGDAIYEYGMATTRDPVRHVDGGRLVTLQDYRDRYAQYRGDALLRAAHAAAPWALIWDDHEVENDYAGTVGGSPFESARDFQTRRAAATQAWWEHMPLPKAARPRGTEVVVHRRLDWGRLARIQLVDARQFRDPQACPRPGRLFGATTVTASDCPALVDPRRTLLGAAQERWLAEGWSLDRPWNLLAQQTLFSGMVVPSDGGHGQGRSASHSGGRRDRQAGSPHPNSGSGMALPDHGATLPSDREVWTDGWDGYAPARSRLLREVASRRVPGLVVLGGDTHTHFVADVHAEPGNPHSPVLGAEFCGTSIASRGRPQARLDAVRADNPHLKFADARYRGNVLFRLDGRTLQADLRAVNDVRDPQSPVRSLARFAVEAGRPGVQAG